MSDEKRRTDFDRHSTEYWEGHQRHLISLERRQHMRRAEDKALVKLVRQAEATCNCCTTSRPAGEDQALEVLADATVPLARIPLRLSGEAG